MAECCTLAAGKPSSWRKYWQIEVSFGFSHYRTLHIQAYWGFRNIWFSGNGGSEWWGLASVPICGLNSQVQGTREGQLSWTWLERGLEKLTIMSEHLQPPCVKANTQLPPTHRSKSHVHLQESFACNFLIAGFKQEERKPPGSTEGWGSEQKCALCQERR